MPQLPALPDLTQAQYDKLVEVFTRIAEQRGLPGPAEAYTAWSLDNLVQIVRSDAYSQLDDEIEQLRQTRRAEVDAALGALIGGG